MKKCTNCGKEINDNMSFCPACGTNLTEQSENLSEQTLSYLEEILDNHKQCVRDNCGKNVETTFGFHIIGKSMFEIKLITDAENRNKLVLSFKNSKRAEEQAFERFKEHELYVLFTAELTQTDGYSGYIELESLDNVVNMVSIIALDVFNYKEGDSSCSIFYVKRVEGQQYELYTMKNGSLVRSKGCMSVVIAFIVLGATIISII